MFKAKYVLIALGVLVSSIVEAQVGITQRLSFENENTGIEDSMLHGPGLFLKDTIHNSWEIGKPNKKTFDSASTGSNVLVTSLNSTYPVNDTSLYSIKFTLPSWVNRSEAEISFDYWLDTDSLKDSCQILLHTATQYQLLNDSINDIYEMIWSTPVPLVTGRTFGWRNVNFKPNLFGTTPSPEDSLFITFFFISDSVDTHHDGVMVDNIEVTYYLDVEYINSEPIDIYPNPVNQYLSFKNLPSDTKLISIRNSNGQIIEQIIPHEDNQVDLSNLASGTYVLEVVSETDTQTTRLIKQ